MKDPIRSTAEFKALRAEAREAIAAYEDGADFLFTISRLAAIGEQMNVCWRRPATFQGRRQPTSARGRPPRFSERQFLSARGFSAEQAVRSFFVLCLEQREMRLARGYDPSSAQSADFVGESAALDAEVVGESLSVERYVKLTRGVLL